MTPRTLAALILLAALLAGCVIPYSLVEPKTQTVGNAIAVEPGMKWNKVGNPGMKGKVEMWTLDGPALNTLIFLTGISDGEPLFTPATVPAAAQEKPPVFRSAMNPLEIQELVQATMARHYGSTIAEARNLRTQSVADGNGFRFDTHLVGQDEVERNGVFVGTVRKGKLYGAWFQGAKLHYFDRYLPEYDKIVASAKLVGEAAKD